MKNTYSDCKRCGQKLIWIRTVAGKSMPCDFNTVYYRQSGDARDRIVLPNGEVVSGQIVENPEEATGVGYRSHFSTCPYADEFRKKG